MTTSQHQPFVFTPAAVAASGGGDAHVASAGINHGNRDPLVQATVREIGDIVREVATAARREQSQDRFLTFFVDRILRAMAAEGVIVWRRASSQTSKPFQPIRSIGRVTESSIPDGGLLAHQKLLGEVASEGQPVVVPATPGARDANVPANPMDVPAAVLAIEDDPTTSECSFVLEIFLDPESGIATQRGYLRFAAQMVDLAGEFLRANQLREVRRQRKTLALVDESVQRFHQQTSTAKLEAEIVDAAADIFQLPRVGLCYLDGRHVDLAAVSHVNRIDRRSTPAKRLTSAAELDLQQDGYVRFDLGEQPDGLSSGFVVGPEDTAAVRLVAFTDPDQESSGMDVDLHQLQRFVTHAYLALAQASRIEAIPGGRLLASLSPGFATQGKRRWLRAVVVVSALTLLLVAALFPFPQIVTASAIVRPADVQSINIPRDAIVQRIHVEHGQTVAAGDSLVTLVDPELEREITELLGQRAVLSQRRSRWTSAIVETPSSQTEQYEQLEGQRRLVMEEIESIDQQLALLTEIKDTLVIRADRGGVVDGWQVKPRLSGRPLRRGDHILAVIADDSTWIAEANIAQNRIAQIRSATSDGSLQAGVMLNADPQQRWNATLTKLGPSYSATVDSVATTCALLSLEGEAFRAQGAMEHQSAISGSPAQVTLECGTAPLAYLLFQDLFRNVRGSIRLLSGSTRSSAGENE